MTSTYPEKHSAWIQTSTGVAFEPLAPDFRLIVLEDVAQSLSNQCRFTGHCRTFYSVAEHCVRVLREVQKYTRSIEIQKMALLHDATEAFLMDLARPVKRDPRMAVFVEFEHKIETEVVKRFDLAGRPSENELINLEDLRMCNAERKVLMGKPPYPWGSLPDATNVSTLGIGWTPKRARREFLAACKYLGVK